MKTNGISIKNHYCLFDKMVSSCENMIEVIANKLGICPPKYSVLEFVNEGRHLCQTYLEFIPGEPFAYSDIFPMEEIESAKLVSTNKVLAWMKSGKIIRLPENTRKQYRWFFQYMVMKHFLKINPEQVSQQDRFEIQYIDRYHQIPPSPSIQIVNNQVQLNLVINHGKHSFNFHLNEGDMLHLEAQNKYKKIKKMTHQLYLHVNQIFI